MNISQDPSFNLSKAEWISSSIVLLTALYVIGISVYPRAKNPTYTETFKIVSKELILQEETWFRHYRHFGRYGAFRPFKTFHPEHYRVLIQWNDDTYPIQVPKNKAYLLKHDKITFSYRITDDGWLRVLEFHDGSGHADSVEILDFGYFRFKNRGDLDFSKLNFISQTDQIPAEIGIGFGFNYKVKGLDEAIYTELTKENSYPGLNDPKHKTPVYRNQYPATMKIGSNDFIYYLLEYDWELVPGEWTFKIKDGDRILAQKNFTIFKP